MVKFTSIISPLIDLYGIFAVAFVPTVKEIWKSPRILFRPSQIFKLFFAKAWAGGFADGIDAGGAEVKMKLIHEHAYGTVFEIGAGQ